MRNGKICNESLDQRLEFINLKGLWHNLKAKAKTPTSCLLSLLNSDKYVKSINGAR